MPYKRFINEDVKYNSMELTPVAIRVTPINGGGFSIYIPQPIAKTVSDVLPHHDDNTKLRSYQIKLCHDPTAHTITLSPL